MANNLGAAPYDYKDYYKPIRGSQLEDTTSMVDKLRAMFSAFGVDQTPVSPTDMSVGAKLRGGLGLAPMVQPTATQADVRKSDNAIAAAMPAANFGAVPAAPAPAQFTPVISGASQADVRASDNAITAGSMPVVDGAWAAPHGASPGIGAQLEAGPATTAVSSSRDANGNLVLTNAPPGPAGPGAAPKEYQPAAGSLASFFGAAMRQKRAVGEERAAQATALKLPDLLKSSAEASILSERMKLAATEPDPARKAAILAGHVMPEPKLQAPPNMQPMPGDKDQSGVVFDPAKGAFRKVPITQTITTANIDAALAGSMKGKTRAQVIQAYRDKGYDVSGIK